MAHLTNEELDREVDGMLMRSWAPSTSKQTLSIFLAFRGKCRRRGWPYMPTDERTLLRYGALIRKTTEMKAQSFTAVLYGIRRMHSANGMALDITEQAMPRLARFKKTWAKEQGDKRDRIAITREVLDDLLWCLVPSHPDTKVWRALFLMAQHAMLRVSEYSYGTGANAPSINALRWIPGPENPKQLVLYFRKSKMNQTGNLERGICICRCPEACAVHAVKEMLRARNRADGNASLFRLSDWSLPTAATINAKLRALANAAGYDAELVASHMLRAGGITDALRGGLPDSVVTELSRHKAVDSLASYKRFTDEVLGDVVRSYGNHPANTKRTPRR